MNTNCLDPLAALREGVSTVHQEAAGVLEVFVVWRAEIPGLVAEAVLGYPLARALATSVAQLIKAANSSPRWEPALCACCPRSVRKKPFTPVVVLPRNDARSQGLGLALCERCVGGRSREELYPMVVKTLRQIWPDNRPLPPITHPEWRPGMNRQQKKQTKRSASRGTRSDPTKLTPRDVWERCPYRTLVGWGADADPETMMRRVRCAIAVIGAGAPEALRPDQLADALGVIADGGVVLLMSDDRAQRDHAKREIMLLAGAAGGVA